MKTYNGVEVQLHAFLTSELNGDEYIKEISQNFERV
jgi:hypothetical protein